MKIKKLTVVGVVGALILSLAAAAWATDWYVPGNFATIQAAIDSSSVVNGDRIIVGPGLHAGAFVTKAVEIKGEGGATITSGPPHGSGLIQGFRLLAGSDGATITHLRFEVGLAIMNGAAVDDVTVTQTTFVNAVQAISNWRGSRWNITHNEIIDLRTFCGGGIGVLIGDYTGGTVTDNVVAHNKIYGTLHVASGDCGGYNGTGIVIFADFRWGADGASSLAWNRVVKNTIGLTSNTPNLVDVVAIELTESGDSDAGWPTTPPNPSVITNNAIGFNDLRDTVLQIALTPSSLDNPTNDISRNLGENRGQGLHPSAFGPGGN
jgi:hypothetical protein